MAHDVHPRSLDQLEGAAQNLLSLELTDPIQMGFWTPNRVWGTAKYLVPLRNYIEKKRAAGDLLPLSPVMQNFKNWVTNNSVYRMWVHSMIDQANLFISTCDEETKKQIKDDDGDTLWIKGYDSFFEILNEIINTSPAFNTTAQVGTPMNGFLAVAMGTKAGAALFHDKEFNRQFKTVLDAWNTFLKSSASLDKLDILEPEKEGSWISVKAHKAGVWHEMEHHPLKPGYGFASWNDFFIRLFKPGARPFLGDPKTQIDIGCETTPYRHQKHLSLQSPFWIKDMPYSLLDLFGGRRRWADLFVGGQAYQGFLSATHYHRWHAPLDGELICSWVEPGTYFAQRPNQGEEQGTWEGTESQPYLGHVAARAIFIFKHATCGYVALICIGMVEVSTCVIEPSAYIVEEDAPSVSITRGTQIGRFEFGGSTHMMIFQKDMVDLVDWAKNIDPKTSTVQHMGSVIATAKTA